MKKVSFIKGQPYSQSDIEFFPQDVFSEYFTEACYREGEDFMCTEYKCTESFTAEITVKIVPYEQ